MRKGFGTWLSRIALLSVLPALSLRAEGGRFADYVDDAPTPQLKREEYIILDVKDLEIMEPCKLETELNNIAGVVTVGLFANRPADVLLLGTAQGVEMRTAK